MPPKSKSLEREKLLVQWLDEIKQDAQEVYLLGDIFDYWFEYKKVVPRGFVRLLAKIAELTEEGIPVHFFTGNHDVWVFDYLPEETGVIVHRKPLIKVFNNKKFYLAHGDGLGPAEWNYRILKSIFNSKILQWLYARIHPNSATGFAHRWSKYSRFSKGNHVPFMGEKEEHLILHSKEILKNENIDFFIFGHRHVMLDHSLNDKSRVIYLGDWFINFSYAKFNGKDVELLKYDSGPFDSAPFDSAQGA